MVCACGDAGTGTVTIMIQKMYCDTFLVWINTQMNLESFLSLSHAILSDTGEYLGGEEGEDPQ